jgi:hypothetical protein
VQVTLQDEYTLPSWAFQELRRLRSRIADLESALPFGGRKLRAILPHSEWCTGLDYCGCVDNGDVKSEAEANLVCSDVGHGRHKPVIDIDLPCTLVESSPGKHHLYIDAEVEHSVYFAMLDAMARAGVVEEGYAKASLRRGYSAVRHPDKPKRRSA